MVTGTNALNTASNKVIHKEVEEKSEVLGNKIADKMVKTKPIISENSRNIEEKIIPPKKVK